MMPRSVYVYRRIVCVYMYMRIYVDTYIYFMLEFLGKSGVFVLVFTVFSHNLLRLT